MKLRRLSELGTRLKSMFQTGDLVLLYHRVADPSRAPLADPFSLCVAPDRFESHLVCLQRISVVKPLSELALPRAQSGDRLPSVAITFDDGYRDNLEEARPRLERFEAPATLFMVSGAIGRKFWWDRLAAMIASCRRLPELVQLKELGCSLEWRRRDHEEDPSSDLLRTLHRRLKTQSDAVIEAVLGKVAEVLDPAPSDDRIPKALSQSELRNMAESDMVEIGSHTVSHRPLARLSRQEQLDELSSSKHSLEELTARPIRALSYPYGTPADIGADSASLARSLDYDVACTNTTGAVTSSSDPMALPRLWVQNWTTDEFEKQVSKWLSN